MKLKLYFLYSEKSNIMDSKAIKTKKPPSKYNVFMSETMNELKENDEHKDLDHKEKFKMAAGMWKTSDKNPANKIQNDDLTTSVVKDVKEKKKKSSNKIKNDTVIDDDDDEIKNEPEKTKKSKNKIKNDSVADPVADVKVKKPPSKYNIYMKTKMAELKQDEKNKDLKHNEIFTMAAGTWKTSNENPANDAK